jgi:hypothetical protein
MISSLQFEERDNRSQHCLNMALSRAAAAAACFNRVAKRDRLPTGQIAFPPQTPFSQRSRREAALRRRLLLINIKQRFSEA